MSIKKPQITRGILLRPDNVALEGKDGEIKVDSVDGKIKAQLGGSAREVLTADQTATITNKTIDADDNTITDLETDNLKAGVLNTSTTLAAASDTQVPSALAVKTYVDNSIATVNDASEIAYSNATSGLTATNVQTAIDEVDGNVDNLVTLSGVALDSVDLGTFTGTTIPDNSNNKQALQALETGLESHLSDTSDAHDASAISVVPTGNLGASEVQAALVELQGDIDAINSSYVSGPVSSTDNALARYDGTTGKIVQDSLVTVSDLGAIAGATAIAVDNLSLDGNVISSTDTDGNVDITPNGTGIINLNKDSRFAQDVAFQITTDSTTTGANATLVTPATKIIRLTNASLSSIDGIPAGSQGQQITVINHSGNTVTINDNTGATAANRVLTGQKSSIQLKDEASLILEYDSTETRWMVIGGTGGAGSASTYISNPDAEAGVVGHVAYADAAGAAPVDGVSGSPSITITRTTSSPLEGAGSFLITKPASNSQGNGVSIDFTIPSGRQASIIPISFTYETSSSYVDGDCRIYIVDVTNTRVIELPQRDLAANARGVYQSSFQASPDSVSYRLVIHVATVSALAYTVKYDEVIVYPRPVVKGSVATDEVDIVPTLNNFGTVTANTASVSRVGDKMLVSGRFTSGTPSASSASITIPFNLSLAVQHTSSTFVTGTWTRDVTNEFTAGKMLVNTANSSLVVFFGNAQSVSSGGLNPLAIANASNIVGAGNVISYQFEISIAGWSSNLVLSEDNSNRLIATRIYSNATQNVTSTAATKVNFQLVKHDTVAAADTVNSRINILESGYYDVRANITLSGATAGEEYRLGIAASVAGSLVTTFMVGSSAGIVRGTASGVSFLNKGDFVEFTITSIIDTSYSILASDSGTWLSVTKISTPQTIAASEEVAARAFQSSGQSIPNATTTTVTWNATKTYDTHNALNAATGVFTCPVAGIYSINATVGLVSTGEAVGTRFIALIEKNAVNYSAYELNSETATAITLRALVLSDEIQLVRGDTITFRVFQNAGAARSLTADNLRNFISISKVG